MYMKAHNSIICNNRKVEIVQIFSSRRMDKYIVIFSCDRIFIAVTMNKLLNTHTQNNKASWITFISCISNITLKNMQTISYVAYQYIHMSKSNVNFPTG